MADESTIKCYVKLGFQGWKKKSKDDVDDSSGTEEEDSQDIDKTSLFSNFQYGKICRLPTKLAQDYPDLKFSHDSRLLNVLGLPLLERIRDLFLNNIFLIHCFPWVFYKEGPNKNHFASDVLDFEGVK